MRAKEFIIEQTKSLQNDVAAALPMTYVIPKLKNQDPYKQYRFGLAIAKAKGNRELNNSYASETPWGENQIIIGFGNTLDDYIDDALANMGLSPRDKKMITSPSSTETEDVNKVSPVPNRKKLKK